MFTKKKETPESLILLFSQKRLVRLLILKQVKPPPSSKMIKPLTLTTSFRHYDILAKTRSRMTTATTFSRQNEAGSPVSIYSVLRNLLLVVVLVSESKALSLLGALCYYECVPCITVRYIFVYKRPIWRKAQKNF